MTLGDTSSLKIKVSADTDEVEAALDRVKEKLEAVAVAARAASEAIASVPRGISLVAQINDAIRDGYRIGS